jgi:hypothetical protein
MSKNNPLVSSTVDISKKISRKLYNEKYIDEYKYDPETCDRNEYYEIVTNGVDFILIKEKDEPTPDIEL